MTYFYNSNTGGFANESPPAPLYFTYETQLHLGQGWHAYGSMAEMTAAINANGWPFPDASKGLLSGTSTVPSSKAVKAIATPINSIDDFLSRLSDSNTWLRIGEGLLGIVLIAVALAKLTGIDNKINDFAAKAAPAIVAM